MPGTVRILRLSDADELSRLVTANGDFLAPWEPHRSSSYPTPEGQRLEIERAIGAFDSGTGVPFAILGGAGEIVGRITLAGIVRGAFLSASIGYWVAEAANGRGLATDAVGATVRYAFDELGLHRVEAATLVHNAASQRVLEKAGFTRYGRAPEYLRIAGMWQDHVLFQRLAGSPA
ncbi:GNAT family N-acetyltransferase [Paramicrobacterium fandaimingii]|uniref:GNAT family N-acetyltransferase n=1 Tax=Paramicrobacterium fandaimingii TaxID=2708079 RepID=UPI0014249BE6|nr:GNAT family protein [Microbacterium fandaimingii]